MIRRDVVISRKDILTARVSPLVRKGLRFRRRFEQAKRVLGPVPFEWYRYDSFSNLFYFQYLLNASSLTFSEVVGNSAVLDLGAGDGALSFFLESLGCHVDAVDFSGSNINEMRGLRTLAAHFESRVRLQDTDLDSCSDAFGGSYGITLFLGTLYHLKNPFSVLERLAHHTRFCFLSTRVARLSADRRVRLDTLPIAYLLDATECNSDSTNYFVFSPAGLLRLVERSGWDVCRYISSGPLASDPVTSEGDERLFMLLKSRVLTL